MAFLAIPVALLSASALGGIGYYWYGPSTRSSTFDTVMTELKQNDPPHPVLKKLEEKKTGIALTLETVREKRATLKKIDEKDRGSNRTVPVNKILEAFETSLTTKKGQLRPVMREPKLCVVSTLPVDETTPPVEEVSVPVIDTAIVGFRTSIEGPPLMKV